MIRAFSGNPVPAIAFISPLCCEDTGAVGVSEPTIGILEKYKKKKS